MNRQLVTQVLRDRASCGLLVRLSWFVGACAVGQLIFAYTVGNPAFGNLLMLFLVCGLAYLWCGAILKSSVQQNLPSNAVLVPGLRSSLMRMTAVLYLVATLFTAALSWLLLDRPGYGLLGAGLFSIYVLYAQRYNWLNLLPSVIVVGSMWITKHPMDKLLAAADTVGEPLVTAIGAVLLALLGRHALHAVFPRGGDRHFAWHQCFSRQLARAKGTVLNTEPGGGMRWLAWLRMPYNAALRFDSRRGAAQGRQMMHVLGTSAHDGGVIAYALVSVIAMSWAGRYLASQTDQIFVMVCSTMMQGMLMMSVLMYAATVATQMVRYSGEQGLYRLTPAAPATAQINRVLLGTLMFRCLRLWGLSVLAIVCIDMIVLGQFELRGITFVLAMLMLPFAGLLLRDYASAPLQQNSLLTVAVSTLVVVIYITLAVVDQTYPGLPLFWFGGAVGVATVVALRLRWQQLMASPAALPSGRMAA
ncbi:hypothetical protein GTP46_07640 [Duganella sp. FT135W]|uniref:Uncharacterized protein n=1 Tax=Duganella flavida TaxID=2692175 RepID=A0A6L8K4U7_9BURK|nr:hypothetical protein [Duganella flavida]MYM22513.1 hypothetical protein [Duganella flavida]